MKILIVDDEYYILNGLRMLIQSNFPELEIFVTEHVSQAKEIMYKEKPEIMITDIKIAEENGLELIRSIRNDFQNTHFYVISGYKEFSYAQSAIELNVRSYILKPIKQKKVIELIENSIQEINERERIQENDLKIQELAKKKIISSMIVEGGCTETTLNEIRRLSFEMYFEKYQLLNISVKESWMIAAYHHSIQISNLKMFMEKRFDEILKRSGVEFYILLEEEIGSYLLMLNMDSASLKKMLHEIYQAVYEDFKLYIEFRMSEECHGTEMFYVAYCQVKGIASDSLRIFFYSDSEQKLINELEQIRCEVVEYMKKKKYIKLATLIDLFIVRYGKIYEENKAVQKFLEELCKEIVSYAEENNILKEKESSSLKNTLKEGWNSLEKIFICLSKEIRSYQQELNLQRNKKMILEVLECIEKDMSNATLDNLAEQIKITPVYLSVIFKEVMGINFKEYLVRKKIDKAKDLLVQTDIQIYKISEMVGYSDVKYFSKIFKRDTGMLPQEYRKQKVKESE